MLRTSALDYPLPEEAIATHPASPRDSAKLLVVPRHDPTPSRTTDAHIRDLPSLLKPGDLLILNASRVLPARFFGVRADTGGRAEGLYLGPASQPTAEAPRLWHAMLKMRRLRPGAIIDLHDQHGGVAGLRLRLLSRPGSDDAAWLVQLETPDGSPPGEDDPAVLARIGATPLPPYILAARKRAADLTPDERDSADYQTVYADSPGSVAAPTAGLHLTRHLLDALSARGIHTATVTLHVGPGTFKPVETEFVEDHPMHAEWCSLPREIARRIIKTRAAGGRVVCVGTTSVRTLESFPDLESIASADATHATHATTSTRLLITPGRPFRHTDALLTNFHLPRSTLMALVAAFLAPNPPLAPDGAAAALIDLYTTALSRRYRFYSFGDAMLII